MHKPSGGRDYVIATLLGASVTVFLGFYLFIRQGYLFSGPPTVDSLYVFNKALASAGTVLIAFIFLIGPIVRYFDRFDKWLGYRKEVGIVGAFLITLHGIIVYFFLPLKSPQSEINLTSYDIAAGVIGAALLIFLFVISFKKAIDIFGAKHWWFMQRWGLRIVVLLTLIHVVGLRWQGWLKWMKQLGKQTPELANPTLPTPSLIAGIFITWVVIVRLYELFFIYKNLGFTGNESSLTAEDKVRGHNFIIRSFYVLVLIYIIVITRWMW